MKMINKKYIKKYLRSIVSSKYRNIVAAITMFIVLDASILGMNFYISLTLSGDAISVSQAGQIQMMSQRLIKSMYELQAALIDNGDSKKPFEELKNTYLNFDESLMAFKTGGVTSSATGDPVTLSEVEDKSGKEIIDRMLEVWVPFRNIIHPVINVPEPNTYIWFIDSLNEAEIYVAANNLTLLKMASNLAKHMELLATQKGERLRLVQTVGISLAILNFIIILYHFIGQLRATDDKIRQAQKETQRILDTVGEGLFLLDNELNISNEHSKYTEKLFGDVNVTSSNFLDLFRDKISSHELHTVNKYLNLLLDDKVNENLVQDLNPLQQVKLSINQSNGQFENKYVSFKFNRAWENNNVVQILVTAQDVTERVNLESKLKEMQGSQGNQLSILTKILDLNPGEFYAFVNENLKRLHHINDVLKNVGRKQDNFSSHINNILAELHKFKGEASLLNMLNMANQVHHMEDVLLALRGSESIDGDDFLPFTVKLKELLKDLEKFKVVAEQLKSVNGDVFINSHDDEVINKKLLESLIQEIADKNNKQVQLIIEQRGKQFIPEPMLRPIRDIVVQLVRNAVVHGVEPVATRVNKEETALINVSILANDKDILIRVLDDGLGIDLNKLKTTVIQNGKWSKQEIESWPDSRVLNLIFEAGISTADKVDEDAGRGIGMSAVRKMISQFNGKISIKNTEGESCRFTIRFQQEEMTRLSECS